MERCVLFVDLDCFFVQCALRQDPSLSGLPVAIQQHQDTIALSYEARALGVKKHTPPAQVRKQFPAVRLVHVPVNKHGKATYDGYWRVSEECFNVIRSALPPQTPLQQASVDECYADLSNTLANPVDAGVAVRAALLTRCGMTASVCIGPNPLICKLAISRAKPDGLFDARERVSDVLAHCAIERLPGCGGAIASTLRARGCEVVKDLQQLSRLDMAEIFGKASDKMLDWAQGIDHTPVEPLGPPRQVCCQMALSAVPLPTLTGPPITPLPLSSPRLTTLYRSLAEEMLGKTNRVAEIYQRTPSQLVVKFTIFSGPEAGAHSRSQGEPTPADILGDTALARVREWCEARAVPSTTILSHITIGAKYDLSLEPKTERGSLVKMFASKGKRKVDCEEEQEGCVEEVPNMPKPSHAHGGSEGNVATGKGMHVCGECGMSVHWLLMGDHIEWHRRKKRKHTTRIGGQSTGGLK